MSAHTPDPGSIAEVNEAQRRINAKLIAAAPDMAEALQTLTSFVERLVSQTNERKQIVAAARAALAKAGL